MLYNFISNNIMDTIKKIRKARKSKKVKFVEPVVKPVVVEPVIVIQPIPEPIRLKPILSSELDDRMKYLNKRLYFCKDENKKISYQQHIDKLQKRKVIKV